MLKSLATLVGVVFLVVGVLGFVPAASTNGLLFGVFHVNVWHNVVHIATGLAALSAGCGCCKLCTVDNWTPKTFFQVFGVIYGVVALLGFWYGSADILGFVANSFADSVLHAVVGVVSLYLGFLYKE